MRRPAAQLATLTGHGDVVNEARFSPDGKLIVTASDDNTARVWDAETGRLRATLTHAAAVNEASFSPDGKRIVTASYDQTARVWEAKTGHLLDNSKRAHPLGLCGRLLARWKAHRHRQRRQNGAGVGGRNRPPAGYFWPGTRPASTPPPFRPMESSSLPPARTVQRDCGTPNRACCWAL
jgi:dipeptidyl aminopeptidase/acylaminoacyl peptidase